MTQAATRFSRPSWRRRSTWSIPTALLLALSLAACGQPALDSAQPNPVGSAPAPQATLDRFSSPTDLTTSAWSGGDVTLWREPVATTIDSDGFLDSLYSTTAGGYTGTALSNASRSGTVQIKFYVHAPKATAAAPVGLYVNAQRTQAFGGQAQYSFYTAATGYSNTVNITSSAVQEITVNVNKNDAATAQLALGGIDPGESVFFGNVRVRFTTDTATTNLVATPSNLYGAGWSRSPDMLGWTVSLAATPEGSSTPETTAQTLHRVVGSTTGAYGYWTTAFKTPNNNTGTLQTRISFVAYTPAPAAPVSMSVEVNSTVPPNPSFASRQVTVSSTPTRFFLDVNKNTSASAYLVFSGFTLNKQVYIGDVREEAQGEFIHTVGYPVRRVYDSAYWGTSLSSVNTVFNVPGKSSFIYDSIGDFVVQRSRPGGVQVLTENGTNYVQLAIKDGFSWDCPKNPDGTYPATITITKPDGSTTTLTCYDRGQLALNYDAPGMNGLGKFNEGDEYEFILKMQQVDAPNYPPTNGSGALIGFQTHDDIAVPPWAMIYIDAPASTPQGMIWRHASSDGLVSYSLTGLGYRSTIASAITYRLRIKFSVTTAGYMFLERWTGSTWQSVDAQPSVVTANVQPPNVVGLGDMALSFYDFGNQFTQPTNPARGKEYKLKLYYFSVAKK